MLECLEAQSERRFGDACQGGVWTGNRFACLTWQACLQGLGQELRMPCTAGAACSSFAYRRIRLLPAWYRAAWALFRYDSRSCYPVQPRTWNPDQLRYRSAQRGRNRAERALSICIRDVVPKSPYEPRKGPWRFETLRCRSARYRVRRPHTCSSCGHVGLALVGYRQRSEDAMRDQEIQRNYASQALFVHSFIVHMLMVPCMFYIHLRRKSKYLHAKQVFRLVWSFGH